FHLHLTDSLTRQIHDGAHVFQGGAAVIRDVESTRLTEFPHFKIREIQLNSTRPRRNINVEVMLAGDVRTRTRPTFAFCACPRLPIVRLRVEKASNFKLSLRHPLDADGPGSHVSFATRAPLLPGDWFHP